ncbi:Fic family protein [Pediococcus pentosaceus]|uniref:Fic family protein n=1 Tax=Pediococcus pentosaceus TaxID=1255 RepID=UPI003160FCC8
MELNHLTDLKAELNKYRPLTKTQIDEINRQKKLEHVWSSNSIEGNTLNRYETATVLETGMTVGGKPIKDYLEVLDLSNAYDYVWDMATKKLPIETIDIRDINRLVTKQTTDRPEEAGVYRAIDVYPNGFPEEKYTNPLDIPQKINDFTDWYNATDNIHPVEKAALAHFKLVSIHPFIDGNGRTSRLLMNFTLMRHGYPIINIMPDKKSRAEYMEVLAESRRTGNADSFVKLVANYEERELRDRLKILKLNNKNLKQAKSESRLKTSTDISKLKNKPKL